MILRIAAALALLLGFGGLGGYLTIMGKTPFASEEARHLRLMKDRSGTPASCQPMTLADFMALPHQAPLAEFSGYERRGVSIEGYMQRMLRAADGDIHFELVEKIPTVYSEPYVTVEVATAGPAAKSWTFSQMEWGLRPWRGAGMGTWNVPPRRVRVSGWLMDDFQHGLPPSGIESANPRVSEWEIHPVTAIDLWNENESRWEPLAP